MTNRNRLKSIHTPPRRDKLSPSKRPPREDDGPNPFALQRHAETIGAGTVCDVKSRKVGLSRTRGAGNMTVNEQGAGLQAEADFAASSSLSRLRAEDVVTSDQYRAGAIYARLNALLFGRGAPKPSALGKVMATSLAQRLEAEARAARDERDDDEYAEWLDDQRIAYRRGEHALSHVQVPMMNEWAKAPARYRAAKLMTIRHQIRVVTRRVCIDDQYPRRTLIGHLRYGLQALADVWEVAR